MTRANTNWFNSMLSKMDMVDIYQGYYQDVYGSEPTHIDFARVNRCTMASELEKLDHIAAKQGILVD
jgi:hypothetical protein